MFRLNPCKTEMYVNWRDAYTGDSLLHFYIRRGNEKIVSALLDAGSDLNARNVQGDTPLIVCVRTGKSHMIDRLVSAGADVNQVNSMERSVLHIAVMLEDIESVEVLLQYTDCRIDLVDRYGMTPLRLAIADGLLDITNALAQKKCMHLRNSLCFANFYNPRMVKLLLDAGASVDVMDDNGESPLHNAVSSGVFESMIMLLDAGSSVNEKNRDGLTPLQIAVKCGTVQMAEALVERGADMTNILIYANYKNPRMVAFLLDAGAEIRVTNDLGQTPLHLAVLAFSLECTHLLFNAIELREALGEST